MDIYYGKSDGIYFCHKKQWYVYKILNPSSSKMMCFYNKTAIFKCFQKKRWIYKKSVLLSWIYQHCVLNMLAKFKRWFLQKRARLLYVYAQNTKTHPGQNSPQNLSLFLYLFIFWYWGECELDVFLWDSKW